MESHYAYNMAAKSHYNQQLEANGLARYVANISEPAQEEEGRQTEAVFMNLFSIVLHAWKGRRSDSALPLSVLLPHYIPWQQR